MAQGRVRLAAAISPRQGQGRCRRARQASLQELSRSFFYRTTWTEETVRFARVMRNICQRRLVLLPPLSGGCLYSIMAARRKLARYRLAWAPNFCSNSWSRIFCIAGESFLDSFFEHTANI